MNLVGGHCQVARRRIALLLRLLQLPCPLGLLSGPCGSCRAIRLRAFAQLALLVTKMVQLGTLLVGLAGVPGLDFHFDVAESLLDHPQPLRGLLVTGRRLTESGARLPLRPSHGVTARLGFAHLDGHARHNGPGVGPLSLGQLGDRGQLLSQFA
jgi:hypothetical protein